MFYGIVLMYMLELVIEYLQLRSYLFERGIVKEQTLKEFQDIIGKMKAQNGIEAVILGCTELPLLLNSENCPVTCLNSVDIHIEKLIGLAMG